MTTRQQLWSDLCLVLEKLEKAQPTETEELLSYLRGKGIGGQVNPQDVSKYAKGVLAGLGEFASERGWGGFNIRLGLTEPIQKVAKGKVKDALVKIHRTLSQQQKALLERLFRQLSPLVKNGLKEFTPEQIATAVLARSLDGDPNTGSRILAALL